MKSYHYYLPIILQKVGYIIFWPILAFFVRLEINGREHLAHLNKPVIFAANHTGEMDAPMFALILPLFSKHFPLYFVSNPQEKFRSFGWRRYFYGGGFFHMLGAYPIFSGHHNYAYALQNHIALLRKGRSVCIFPEGRRTQNGSLSPAHGGVAYLAYTTGAYVVPIAINSFFDMTWQDFFLRRRKVTVTIGAPIPAEQIVPEKNPNVEDFKRGGQRVVDVIGNLLQSQPLFVIVDNPIDPA